MLCFLPRSAFHFCTLNRQQPLGQQIHQAVDLLFIGDGVLQLQPDQDSTTFGMKNMGRQLASLPLYDIDHVYVDAQAAARYNMDLSKAPLHTRQLDDHEIHQLMVGYDHLLGF